MHIKDTVDIRRHVSETVCKTVVMDKGVGDEEDEQYGRNLLSMQTGGVLVSMALCCRSSGSCESMAHVALALLTAVLQNKVPLRCN
jgi:hypothetical protein